MNYFFLITLGATLIEFHLHYSFNTSSCIKMQLSVTNFLEYIICSFLETSCLLLPPNEWWVNFLSCILKVLFHYFHFHFADTTLRDYWVDNGASFGLKLPTFWDGNTVSDCYCCSPLVAGLYSEMQTFVHNINIILGI